MGPAASVDGFVIYYCPPSADTVRAAITAGLLGCITAPKGPRKFPSGWDVIADNGCFGGSWTEDNWVQWLVGVDRSVRFATAPDVVDLTGRPTHDPTVRRWDKYAPFIADLGFTPAFVCQKGATPRNTPTEAEVLFLGGPTEWKLGPDAEELTRWATSRNVWVHMGRVNSKKRVAYAKSIGCDSVDGTYVVFGPDTNVQKLLQWLVEVDREPTLWEANQ